MLGVSVQKFHRLAAKHGIVPVFKMPGRTGGKLWNPVAVELIRRLEVDGAAEGTVETPPTTNAQAECAEATAVAEWIRQPAPALIPTCFSLNVAAPTE